MQRKALVSVQAPRAFARRPTEEVTASVDGINQLLLIPYRYPHLGSGFRSEVTVIYARHVESNLSDFSLEGNEL